MTHCLGGLQGHQLGDVNPEVRTPVRSLLRLIGNDLGLKVLDGVLAVSGVGPRAVGSNLEYFGSDNNHLIGCLR